MAQAKSIEASAYAVTDRLADAVNGLTDAVTKARMQPRLGWVISRNIGADGTEGEIYIEANCTLWPGMRVTVATFTVEGFRAFIDDCLGILGALDGKAMQEGEQRPAKHTPDEWLTTEEFAGLEIVNPDGWDRRNFTEDWQRPLTLEEFRGRLAVCTIRPRKAIAEGREVERGG